MPARRTLALKREVLQELSSADLSAVVAAGGLTNTCYSCLAYISCDIVHCVAETLLCVE